jgi:drug/metabolite transporter (DMT)-like permease
MSATFLATIFALSAAVVWGTGDFTGGYNARRVGAFHALLLSFPFGLIALLIAAFVSGEPMSAPADLVWGAVGGLFGAAGFLCMLQGFAVGRMGVVAPVSAVLAAALPVVYAAFSEGVPSGLKLFGFGLAFVSIWLLSQRRVDEAKSSGFILAVFAGLGFALFFITLDRISPGATFWPLVVSRIMATLLLIVLTLATKRSLLPAKPPYALLAASGVLDVSGNFLFLRAVQTGRLDIASVLVSLYPAITVLLARIVEKEHLTQLQIFAVVLAVASIALITV